jgi:hypothetical protein
VLPSRGARLASLPSTLRATRNLPEFDPLTMRHIIGLRPTQAGAVRRLPSSAPTVGDRWRAPTSGLDPSRTTPAPKASPSRTTTLGDGESGRSRLPWHLSLGVRSGPVATVVNGTLVARPARTIAVELGGVWRRLDHRVRPVPGHPPPCGLASQWRRGRNSTLTL